MGHKFAELAFTNEVKKVQIAQRSRNSYAQMEQGEDVNYLMGEREADFIRARDSFYMASVSETNWPYVQHRGGPAGFIKVLDEKTLGIADYTGNRQYVSTGNFNNNDRVALILMDYPNRTRLKILGRVSIIPESNTDTLATLEDDEYRARIERGFIIHIDAFDWNCPKHITPRYSETEIETLIAPIVAENRKLKMNLAENVSATGKKLPLGNGSLPLTVSGIRQLTPRVRAFELRALNGELLPEINAGAHLEIPVNIHGNEVSSRHYSICSNPSRRDIYEIAVLNETEGRGGSSTIHQQFTLGQVLRCQPADNYFKLLDNNQPVVLIAGGIGITPIKAMAQTLKAKGKPFSLHYAGRSRKEMAFLDRLEREFGNKMSVYSTAENVRLKIKELIDASASDSHFYLCGPVKLIEEFKLQATQQGIASEQIHYESFSKVNNNNAKPITIQLNKSNKEIHVSKDETILDALLAADIDIPYSCQTGNCKTCAVRVTSGEPEHFDHVLTNDEKERQHLMCPCVSRAKSSQLSIDI